MKKTIRENFESSVCRESDKHDWKFFVSYQENGEWVHCTFDANAKGLEDCLSMRDMVWWSVENPATHVEILESWLHARKLNRDLGFTIGWKIPKDKPVAKLSAADIL